MKAGYDVVIVGGGVIGSSIAFYLSKLKHISVALIDTKKKGNASYASAGGLWQLGDLIGFGGCGQLDDENHSASNGTARASEYPDYFIDLCMNSNAKFSALWHEMKYDYGMDFKYEQTGLKFIVYDETEMRHAKQIAAQLDHLKEHFTWLDESDLRQAEPNISRESMGALMFLNDHQVNPFKLVDAFREGARRNGVDLFLDSKVNNVTVRNHRIESVSTDQEQVSCSNLINATGAWGAEIMEWVTDVRLPVKPIKGQCLISERLPRILNSCISSNDCFIVQKDGGEILVGSTTEDAGFDASCTYHSLRSLAKGAVRCLPDLRNIHIKRSWVGFRPGSPDGMPILGSVPGIEGLYNACGHYKTGVLTSLITGEIFASLMDGREPPVDISPYHLSRFDSS